MPVEPDYIRMGMKVEGQLKGKSSCIRLIGLTVCKTLLFQIWGKCRRNQLMRISHSIWSYLDPKPDMEGKPPCCKCKLRCVCVCVCVFLYCITSWWILIDDPYQLQIKLEGLTWSWIFFRVWDCGDLFRPEEGTLRRSGIYYLDFVNGQELSVLRYSIWKALCTLSAIRPHVDAECWNSFDGQCIGLLGNVILSGIVGECGVTTLSLKGCRVVAGHSTFSYLGLCLANSCDVGS